MQIIASFHRYQLYCNPSLEVERMERWELQWSEVLMRTALVTCVPIVLHSIDTASNQDALIAAYGKKPLLFQMIYTLTSLGFIGLIYDICLPNTDDSEATRWVSGVSMKHYLQNSKVISAIVNAFGVCLIYLLIFRRIPSSHAKKSS